MTMMKATRVSGVILILLIAGQAGLADDPNMLGWWPLSEGVGDVVMDVSGNGNDGVIGGENGGWVEDPAFGSVLYFGSDANGLFVYAGEIPQMTLESGFTWTFWGNQDPALVDPLNQIVLGNRYNAEGADFDPRQFTKFTPTKFEWHNNGADAGNLSYSEPMVPGEWNHHALIKDANQVTYYRNGVKDAQGIIISGLDHPMPLYFGGDGNGRVTENWMGMMSDVRLFTEALSTVRLADVVPVVLDNFEGDPNLPAWTIDDPNAAVVAVDPLDPNNNALRGAAGPLHMSQPLVVDPNGHVTFSFRVLYEDIDPNVPNDVNNDLVIAVGDGAGTEWGNLYAIVRLGQGERLDFRNGGAYGTMVPATEPLSWYSIIMDIDSAAKTYDVYVDDMMLVEDAAFRSQDPGGIQRVWIKQGDGNAGLAYVDDLVIGLAVPEQPEPEPEPVVE